MKHYQKPIVLLNSDLSEGVYTASGATSGNYTIGEAGSGSDFREYRLSITNTSNEWVDSVTITVEVYGNVTSIEGDKGVTCNYINGSTIATITFNNHGAGFAGTETISSIPVRVYGTGEFGIR